MIKIIPLMLLLLAGTSVNSEPLATSKTDDEDEALWEMHLAAFGQYGAAYPASEDDNFNFIPIPYPVYRGKIFRIGEDTANPIKGRVFRTDRIKLDFEFDLNFGADSSDIEAREDMPDLDFVLEVGPKLEIEFARQPLIGGAWFFMPQVKLATSFDGLSPSFEGFVFSPELKWRRAFAGKRNLLKFKITPAWATEDYMDYYYTVDSEFATATRPAYDASGGYLGTEVGLSWQRSLTDELIIALGGGVSFYKGATNDDSPLFKDDVNSSVFLAFLWKFWESERREPADE
jgi:outer membrane protein